MNNLRSFTRQAGILEDSFYRYDVGLNLDALADNPVERSGNLQGIRHCQSHHASTQTAVACDRDNGETRSGKNNDGTDELQA